MKTLIHKLTNQYIVLPSRFSDVPEIWHDDYVHTLEIIIPDVAANLKIESTEIEIVDIDIIRRAVKTENEVISDKIIDHFYLAVLLKEGCVGSNDYLSGVNDGVYKALHHCLDKKITLPVADVRQRAKEFVEKLSKEPSMLSTESMLVKFYCDMNGTVKRITNDEFKLPPLRECTDCGTKFSSRGRCPECNPMG
jgi:hypothetical protein